MAQEEHVHRHTDNISPPPSLPEHLILYEIFARLPVKSIHRLLCVSTSCRRLTSDHQFLSAFRRLSGRRHYFLSIYPNQGEPALYSLNQSGFARHIPQNPSHHPSLVNGLMFTVHAGHKFTVSNADTEEKFHLPPLPPLSTTNVDYRLSFYLCHDPEIDKYKVLHIAAPRGDDEKDDGTLELLKCSIFTLGDDTSWRGYGDIPSFKQLGNSRSVCIDGTLYLTRFCLGDIVDVISAFILEEEYIYAVGYPAGLSPSRYNECHLIELKGALAVIDVGLRKREIKLWIKEKGRVELGSHESWTELRIDFDPRWEMDFRVLRSFSFSTNYDGEIVMGVVTGMNTKDGGCWIFIYNMEKGEWTRRVEMQGLGDHSIASVSLGVDQENVLNPLILKRILYSSSPTSSSSNLN